MTKTFTLQRKLKKFKSLVYVDNPSRSDRDSNTSDLISRFIEFIFDAYLQRWFSIVRKSEKPLRDARRRGLSDTESWNRMRMQKADANSELLLTNYKPKSSAPNQTWAWNQFLEGLTDERLTYPDCSERFFLSPARYPLDLSPHSSQLLNQTLQNKQQSYRGGAKNHGEPVPCPSVDSASKNRNR